MEETARRALRSRLYVLPVVDAMTGLNGDAHRHGVENVFPLISETATTIDVLALLKPRSRQEGREARSAISLRGLIALASDSNVASMSTSTQRIVMRKCVSESEATSISIVQSLEQGTLDVGWCGATALHLHGYAGTAGADEPIAPYHAAIR